MKEIPYYASYSRTRRIIHDVCNSKYFDLIIAGVIGLNVVSMSLEFYLMPPVRKNVLNLLMIFFFSKLIPSTRLSLSKNENFFVIT
jgi:hypothetical protein